MHFSPVEHWNCLELQAAEKKIQMEKKLQIDLLHLGSKEFHKSKLNFSYFLADLEFID